jgi:hypothetical protein
MKTLLNKLLQGRNTRWGFLAVLLIAAGATVAGMNQRHYQLGGSFVGELQGNRWNTIHMPLDPDGRTAALTVQFVTLNAEQALLMQYLGAQTLSQGVGEVAMIDRDTAKYTYVMYAVAQPNPPEPAQIKAIFLVNGTWDITGRDSAMSAETFLTYSPDADGDHDGLPDSTATPILPPAVFPPHPEHRVPILR